MQFMDTDTDGFISIVDLKDTLKKASIDVTQDELRDMIAAADLNSDGKIDRSEFFKLYDIIEP